MVEKEVAFENASGETLAGYLHEQEGDVKAAVVLAHCFTCSRHIKVMRKMCDGLAANGFLVLRFDFSGNGDSEGDFKESTYSKQVQDFCAAYDFLKKKHKGKIAVVGHSMGAAVALLASAKRKMYALALVAGQSSTAGIKALFEDHLERIEKEGLAQIMIAGGEHTVTKEFVRDAERHDLAKVLRRGTAPILFVHGSEDAVIPPSCSEENYGIAKEPKRLEIIQGAGHMFSRKEDLTRLIAVVYEWFTEHL